MMRREIIPQVLVWALCFVVMILVSNLNPGLAVAGEPSVNDPISLENPEGPSNLGGNGGGELGGGQPGFDTGDDDDYWDEIHWDPNDGRDVGLFPAFQMMLENLRIMIVWQLL
jgi:hypothetical protein